MKKIILLNKKEGETPLEALQNFRKKNKKYKDVKITYAGRLDPMASGLLLLLTGEEVKKKEKYLGLSKEYEFEVLFGFSTDTFDILGKVLLSRRNTGEKELKRLIENNLKSFKGEFIQNYPAYSSKTVKGKPLFEYAREGIEVTSPKRKVVVKKLQLLKMRRISSLRLLTMTEKRIGRVRGDFRQKEIVKIWRMKLLENSGNFYVAKFKIKCSSGTYVRGIADSLGKEIGIPALAYSIKRTSVGNFREVR